jgi:4-amino-4-deoxy-L-arabinose transferase-like glycosyltransferase
MLPSSGDLRMKADKSSILTAFLLTILLWGMHFIWFRRDTRPPVWDMALHQTYALSYLEGRNLNNEGATGPWQNSGNYPPFVHLVIAAVFWIFHPGPHIAALANIPASFILFWALYELAKDLAGSVAGRWACILAALTPYLIWISRETVLDYWLSAWFTAALVVLRKSRGFQSRPWSLLLGAIIGMGLLTKWFFAGIFLFPIAYVLLSSRIWKYPARCIHFLDSAIIGGGVAAVWYLPNIQGLVQYFSWNAEIGAREGEPHIISFQSFIYYLRLLEGYQLFGVLFIVLLLACFFCWRKKLIADWKFLAAAVAGGWLVLTLLRTKDPRFTLPLICPLMIFPGAWIQSWKRTGLNTTILGALMLVLCFQAYAANFGISWLPEHVVILKGYQGSLRWDWNLYLQNYFGILGKPKREDWKQDEILRVLTADAAKKSVRPTLALIPDLPWFNESNFNLYARTRRLPIRIQHLQSGSNGFHSFDGYNYVLMTTGDQGMSWSTTGSGTLNRIVVDNPADFHLVELYRLPNGDSARLYFIAGALPVSRSQSPVGD